MTEEHRVNLDTKALQAPGVPRAPQAQKARRAFQEIPAKPSTLLFLSAVANPSTAWSPTRRSCLTRCSSTWTTTSTCSTGNLCAASRGSTSSTSTFTRGTSRRRIYTSCTTTRSRPSCTPSPATAPSCRVRA